MAINWCYQIINSGLLLLARPLLLFICFFFFFWVLLAVVVLLLLLLLFVVVVVVQFFTVRCSSLPDVAAVPHHLLPKLLLDHSPAKRIFSNAKEGEGDDTIQLISAIRIDCFVCFAKYILLFS